MNGRVSCTNPNWWLGGSRSGSHSSSGVTIRNPAEDIAPLAMVLVVTQVRDREWNTQQDTPSGHHLKLPRLNLPPAKAGVGRCQKFVEHVSSTTKKRQT